MLSNNLFGFRDFLPIWLMFYVGRARPHAYLSRRWAVRITRTGPRGEELRGQLGS